MERFIDAAVEQFARDHTEPETDLYTRLREETYRVMQRPQMQIDVIEGRFLQLLVRLSGAKSILELGMFTGYSALMMAEALPDDGTGLLDLVFIDADKVNYSNYYEACVPLVRAGGLIIADNVLWSGKVVDPKDADDHAIVAFNRLVRSDPRVKNVCLTVRDGMMLAWKRAG